ncbi:MAG: lipocalin family protein [Hyphomicrobium sp.]
MIPGAAWSTTEPRRPIDIDRFMGRWYEILRTPNNHQRNCWAASQLWSRRDDGGFSIRQTCHRGSPTGRIQNFTTSARVLNAPQNNKFEASFFGGLLRQRYWVIDRADDYSWMIATTADGEFPALLSRRPTMSAAETARLRRRMAELGLPTAQLTASDH